MDPARLLRLARHRSGLGLRELARRSGTSHATLSAYERGQKEPRLDTLARIVEASGFDLEVALGGAVVGDDRRAKAHEIEQVLALASEFPARHHPRLRGPVFGRPA